MTRPIDAEALKAKLSDKDYITYTHEYGNAIPVEWVMSAIDNAPTVFDCRSCKNNGNERECVDCHDYSNYVRYEKRPQGEWIDGCCNKCGGSAFCDGWGRDVETRFCPTCGADMRKGGAEE